MGLKEIFYPRRSLEGIKIERETYSPSGELPLPLAMRRAEELKKRSRIGRVIGRLRRG